MGQRSTLAFNTALHNLKPVFVGMSGRNPVIRIQAIPEKPSRFIASFHAEFLNATYALTFSETVTGALALHRFARMIENQYGKQAQIQISEELLPFHNEAVTDILVGLGITEAQSLPLSDRWIFFCPFFLAAPPWDIVSQGGACNGSPQPMTT